MFHLTGYQSYNYEANSKAISLNTMLNKKITLFKAKIDSYEKDSGDLMTLWNQGWLFIRDFTMNQMRDPTHGLNGEAELWINKIDKAMADMET